MISKHMREGITIKIFEESFHTTSIIQYIREENRQILIDSQDTCFPAQKNEKSITMLKDQERKGAIHSLEPQPRSPH